MKKTMIKNITTIFFALTILFLSPIIVHSDSYSVYCESQGMDIDACIKNIAVERKDITICDRIESDDMQGSCRGAFATINNDMTLCREIPKSTSGFDARYRCYIKFVKTMDDMHICDDLIKEDRFKDECYDEIFDNSKDDASLCTKYSTDKKRANCYVKVAKHMKDPAMCDLVLSEKNTGRASQCRYCENEGTDFDAIYTGCKKYFFMKSIKSRCDEDYEKKFEDRVAWHEKREYAFIQEHPTKDKFWVTLRWGNFEGSIEQFSADFEVSDGVKKEILGGIRMGQFAVFNEIDLAVQVLDLWQEEDDEGKDVTHANICIFRPGSLPKPEPKKEEETEEKTKEEAENEETKTEKENVEESNKDTEEKTAEEPGKTNQEESAEEPEKEPKVVKIKEGGFFDTLIKIFKKLLFLE